MENWVPMARNTKQDQEEETVCLSGLILKYELVSQSTQLESPNLKP